MVKVLLIVFYVVHQTFHLVLSCNSKSHTFLWGVFHRHCDIILGRLSCKLGLKLALLVVSVDLKEILANKTSKLGLQGFR